MNIAELKKIAEAATPGPWYNCGCRYTMISRDFNDNEIEDIAEVCNHFQKEEQVAANKNHISTFNPELILRLLTNYEKAVEALKFYSDKKNWDERWVDSLDEESSGDIADIISINDYDYSGGENEIITGGKLARQTLKELGEL